MRQVIESLVEEITKLETEVTLIDQLDNRISKRIIQNRRLKTLKEIKDALEYIEINAKKRSTFELFIFAEPIKANIFFNANQFYSFKLITSDFIELKTQTSFEVGIKYLWNKTNRLTLFTEFKDRAEMLLDKMEAEELDEYLGYSASELLFEIMGVNGELLEQLGIDVTKSHTSNRINQIIEKNRTIFGFFIEQN
jgi:hypothetical protein